jgi:hypothetical protein
MDASLSAGRSRRAATKLTPETPDPSRAKSPAAADFAISEAGAKAVRRLDWHPTAPQAILDAVAPGDTARVWKLWRRELAESPQPSLAKLLRTKSRPLAWALPAAAAQQSTLSLIALTSKNDRAVRKRLAAGASWNEIAGNWLAESKDTQASIAHAIESLAWCHALPWLANELLPEVWCGLFEHLVAVATDSAALTLHADPLQHQLYAGELPLALAYQFPQIKNTRAMRKLARRALSRGPADLLNGEGLPTWADLAVARPLLACWTRCVALGGQFKKLGLGDSCWDSEAANQYRWFVLASLRLARRDGSQMLVPAATDAASGSGELDLFAAAVRLADDKALRELAGVVLPKSASSKSDRKAGKSAAAIYNSREDKKRLPPASYHCEWSGLSILRPTWRRGGTRLALAFGNQQLLLELCRGRDVVLSGVWNATITLDGRELAPIGTWEESCWISDRWIDYVELQLPLAENIVLQRHIVLPREDDFLFLADAVVGRGWKPPQRDDDQRSIGHYPSGNGANGSPAAQNGDSHSAAQHTIAYQGTLPLASGIKFVPEAETREAVLQGTRDRALVMPLALPEWRTDPRGGAFACVGNVLNLRQSNAGTSLVAPLFFDLSRLRFSGQRTWRQLTVAEDRKIQPPDRAVGYRVQTGDKQWIIYRSLTARGNRSLLSHNLSSEFLVARFDPAATGASLADTLVEIE